jgi:surfactin synthase thioesterase subunit
MWDMYQPMLRADFRLFDEYTPSKTQAEAQAAPFAFKLRLFWGQKDRRVTEEMVKVGTSSPTLAAATASLG